MLHLQRMFPIGSQQSQVLNRKRAQQSKSRTTTKRTSKGRPARLFFNHSTRPPLVLVHFDSSRPRINWEQQNSLFPDSLHCKEMHMP